MRKELILPKKTVSVDKLTKDVDIIATVNYITQKPDNHRSKMGADSCTLCDCPKFNPSSCGQTCINYNSAGGTCNHYESEHN